MEMVKIRECQDVIEAQMLAAVLEAEGIKASVQDDQVHGAIMKGLFAQDGFASLWVMQADTERALAILDRETAYPKGPSGEPADEDGQDSPCDEDDLDEQARRDQDADGGQDDREDDEQEDQAAPPMALGLLVLIWMIFLPVLVFLAAGVADAIQQVAHDWRIPDWRASVFAWRVVQFVVCLVLVLLLVRIPVSATRRYRRKEG